MIVAGDDTPSIADIHSDRQRERGKSTRKFTRGRAECTLNVKSKSVSSVNNEEKKKPKNLKDPMKKKKPQKLERCKL